jgi:hypothetical protein
MEQFVYLVLLNLQAVLNVHWEIVLHATKHDIWRVRPIVVFVMLDYLGVKFVLQVLHALCVQ